MGIAMLFGQEPLFEAHVLCMGKHKKPSTGSNDQRRVYRIGANFSVIATHSASRRDFYLSGIPCRHSHVDDYNPLCLRRDFYSHQASQEQYDNYNPLCFTQRLLFNLPFWKRVSLLPTLLSQRLLPKPRTAQPSLQPTLLYAENSRRSQSYLVISTHSALHRDFYESCLNLPERCCRFNPLCITQRLLLSTP